MARSSTKNATVGDMIRSLAVILVPLMIITVLFTRNVGDAPVAVIDYGPLLTTARAEAPYPVLAPANLPATWRPTQASWTKAGTVGPDGQPSPRNAWVLGYLDPSDTYISIYQGDLKAEDLVDAATRQGAPDGTSTVAGDTWDRRVSGDGRTRSLVLAGPKVTTVIAGDVDYETLDAYTATLRS